MFRNRQWPTITIGGIASVLGAAWESYRLLPHSAIEAILTKVEHVRLIYDMLSFLEETSWLLPWLVILAGFLVIWLGTRRSRPKHRPLKVPYFPDRKALQEFSGGSLGARLAQVETASAIMVNGLTVYGAEVNTGQIKRLLLPNPNGEAFKFHLSTQVHSKQDDALKQATEIAQKLGTKVRWYDHYICHSIILADTDKPTGWVQVESIIPYSKASHRPSYTLDRKTSDQAVREIQRIFDEM